MQLLSIASEGEYTRLFLTLSVMYVVAKLTAELFDRLKLPAGAVEILDGNLIGPSARGWVAPSDLTAALSEVVSFFYWSRRFGDEVIGDLLCGRVCISHRFHRGT